MVCVLPQGRVGGLIRMRWPLVLALIAGIAASACGSGTAPSGSGTLRMMIKDSPFRDAKALLVTFSEVDVHKSDTPDDAWIKVAITKTCDLKRLETSPDALGAGTFTSGHYTQIRLVVSSAVVYFDNPTTAPDACKVTPPDASVPAGDSAAVTIPSGEVKLNRPFDIPEGGATTVLLDFDGDKSVHMLPSGQYMMSPVIGVVSVQ
jgi:uncharacterized protein DUF4382